ncbi:unnamed protein product [Trypanosoma congolense IL3000]|uniref:WGS project CAEQ00000000 data, annotated contig 11 n=1 Tax=Trypanosoma congolense (strain IL3000) TaxID=1068625 RepID=F9W478_TRYCI|nr:unnamed protein product [Trypanosoma congolense IL3000]
MASFTQTFQYLLPLGYWVPTVLGSTALKYITPRSAAAIVFWVVCCMQSCLWTTGRSVQRTKKYVMLFSLSMLLHLRQEASEGAPMSLKLTFFFTFSMEMGHYVIIRTHIQVLLVLRDVAHLTQRHRCGGDPAAARNVTHYEMEKCGSGIVETLTRVFFFTKRFLGRLLGFLEML